MNGPPVPGAAGAHHHQFCQPPLGQPPLRKPPQGLFRQPPLTKGPTVGILRQLSSVPLRNVPMGMLRNEPTGVLRKPPMGELPKPPKGVLIKAPLRNSKLVASVSSPGRLAAAASRSA